MVVSPEVSELMTGDPRFSFVSVDSDAHEGFEQLWPGSIQNKEEIELPPNIPEVAPADVRLVRRFIPHACWYRILDKDVSAPDIRNCPDEMRPGL